MNIVHAGSSFVINEVIFAAHIFSVQKFRPFYYDNFFTVCKDVLVGIL